MKHRTSRGLAIGCATFLCLFGSAISAADLDVAEFQKLHKELRPEPDAAWRSIPWKISLLDAQRIAAEQKRPLFIWAMDGHPLGCT